MLNIKEAFSLLLETKEQFKKMMILHLRDSHSKKSSDDEKEICTMQVKEYQIKIKIIDGIIDYFNERIILKEDK